MRRRRRSKSSGQSMAPDTRRSRRARRVRRARPQLESAIVDERTPRLGCDGCSRTRGFRPSRVSQKEIITSAGQAIEQTHRYASRDRVNPRASRFASRSHCRQQQHLQNATRRGLALDLRCQTQPRPVNR